MEGLSQMFMNQDNSGNKLYLRVFFDAKKQPRTAIILLKLKGESYPRQLGNYNFDTKTFFCKRNSTKHYHYKTKGYGFNWTILEDPMLDVQNIHMVVDEKEHYIFNKSLIAEYGRFLNFKQQGFELQRFMSMELIRLHAKKESK